MFKSKKTVQKSIRMTNEVYNFVEAFEGEGFNEKFENLVLFCLREEKDIKKSLQIQKKTHEANEKRIELQRKVLSDLENISRSVSSLLDMAKKSEVTVKGVQLKMIEAEQCEEVPKAKNVTQKQSSGSSPRRRNELQKKAV